MFLDFSSLQLNNKTVAVALSGGADSMALLYYMRSVADYYSFKLVAVNVEHGIRGESSKRDSKFVIDHCASIGVPCYAYVVDAPAFAKERKLSIEQAARLLRYDCFNDAVSTGKCDLVATAHHRRDNVESVLLNLFRGTGLKGLAGINTDFNGKIIRPFINLSKEELDEYVKENAIPFVVDETNLSDDYTRNFLRLNVIPKIKEVFPEMEKSVARLSEIARGEDEFLDGLARQAVNFLGDVAELDVTAHPAVLSRAVIIALKALGLKKDWEKAHVESIVNLKTLDNGDMITLPKNLYAIREYDKIVISKKLQNNTNETPFSLGEIKFGDYALRASIATPASFFDGLYADLDKIPFGAVIRAKREGDAFTKFGGGTKKLNDYLTDKKIPLRLRDGLPVLASKNQVLCVFGVAISEIVKVDENTKTIIKLERDDL